MEVGQVYYLSLIALCIIFLLLSFFIAGEWPGDGKEDEKEDEEGEEEEEEGEGEEEEEPNYSVVSFFFPKILFLSGVFLLLFYLHFKKNAMQYRIR